MELSRRKKIIITFLLIFVAVISTVILIINLRSVNSKDVFFYPTDPNDINSLNTEYQIHGKLYFPNNFDQSKNYSGLILFHGINRNLGDLEEICKRSVKYGFVCLSIDFHGHGKSGGEFPFDDPNRYNETFGDAKGAYRYLSGLNYINSSEIAVIGQSLGGGAALYLALEGLCPKFCVWYPGSAYIYQNKPLYNHTSSNPKFEGFIIQGTADECSRCKPEYTQHFVDINSPKITIHWIEGGTHGASGLDWFKYLDLTENWVKNLKF